MRHVNLCLALAIFLCGCQNSSETVVTSEESASLDELARGIANAHEVTGWKKIECEVMNSDERGTYYRVRGIPYATDDHLMFRIDPEGNVEHDSVP